jgi:hypothetical protein
MAQIYNSDLTKELIEGAKIQTAFDVVPNQIAEKVVPTMEVNPKILQKLNYAHSNTATNATSVTIYTTPTDQDFYLSAVTLSLIKDVTSTSVKSAVTATINGVAQDLLSIPGITLTAQTAQISLSLPRDLKIDRGTNIVVTNSTNVANILATGVIFGYLVYNTTA